MHIRVGLWLLGVLVALASLCHADQPRYVLHTVLVECTAREAAQLNLHAGLTRNRHSLGTLNVGELGMKLSPYYLMRRYRHNDIKTTMEVYVARNPLLDEAQHVAIVNAANGNGHAMTQDPKPKAMADDITVAEMEATTQVRALGVNWRSLREHALAQRAAVQRGAHFFYSASFLDSLCTTWMTREEAMEDLGLASVSGFQYKVRAEQIRTLVIGRASLVHAGDVRRVRRGSRGLAAE